MRVRALLAVPLATAALAAAVVPALSTGASAKQATASPLVFGHRGASGYRPEHTLASYDLAVRMGADVIEPDLVSTKDHVLVARHENEIGGTTDVATVFPSRSATKTVDGTVIRGGYFTEDFTLAELKTLRAKERLPLVRQENTVFDGRYQVPTLREVLDYAKAASKQYGRTIGVAPETKHPTYFDSIGLSLEEPLLDELRQAGLDKTTSRVYVQSFEERNLRELHDAGVKVPLVQLTSTTGRPYDHVAANDPETYAQMQTPAGLREVATYADVLGPDKAQVFPRASDGTTSSPSRVVSDAHAAGLQVVPYTVRAENQFLPAQYRRGTDPNAFGDVLSEFRDLYGTGIDGLFSDQPDLARQARDGS
ncbi:MAG: glycerophosphodiester phosphodiesterase [Frankiales bacterium]|nr:glycerophosphodiester phosphodiesterase [Frankiales bacterium]